MKASRVFFLLFQKHPMLCQDVLFRERRKVAPGYGLFLWELQDRKYANNVYAFF